MEATDSGHRPWDPGLQLERTTLAWFRTSLALLAGSVITVRLIGRESVSAGLASMLLALPLAVLVTWLAWRRHVRSERRLHAAEPLPDGRLHLAISAAGCLLGCSGLAYVLLGE